jgi:hypothetical protein
VASKDSKSNYNYKTVLRQVFSYLNREISAGKKVNLDKFRQKLLNTLKNQPNLTSTEVSELFGVIYRGIVKNVVQANFKGQLIMSASEFEKIYQGARNVWLRVRQKEKLQSTRAVVKDSVFVMCSKHYPVAADHKDWQGKLYVNQGWRNMVSGSEYRAVNEYVKENGIITIQSVMKNPPYLITRPNCRHKLVKVPVSAVLGGLANDYMIVTHSKKKYDRKADLKEYRSEIFAKYNVVFR